MHFYRIDFIYIYIASVNQILSVHWNPGFILWQFDVRLRNELFAEIILCNCRMFSANYPEMVYSVAESTFKVKYFHWAIREISTNKNIIGNKVIKLLYFFYKGCKINKTNSRVTHRLGKKIKSRENCINLVGPN